MGSVSYLCEIQARVKIFFHDVSELHFIKVKKAEVSGIFILILIELENNFGSLKRKLRAILYLYNFVYNHEELIRKMLVLQMLFALELGFFIKDSKFPL